MIKGENVRSLDASEIWDITPVINPRLAVFPGDTPFENQFVLDMHQGHNLTLSWMKSTVHLGAHVDAPNHYSRDGVSIEKRDLKRYLGTAQVIEVPRRPGTRLSVADLKGREIAAPRVLFKTNSFPDPSTWNGDFMALSAELVDFLASKGVILVGIDTPSIDPADDKVLESHGAVARHDLGILEGIVLTKVPEGVYQLIALPLPIEGADASPVRAILVR